MKKPDGDKVVRIMCDARCDCTARKPESVDKSNAACTSTISVADHRLQDIAVQIRDLLCIEIELQRFSDDLVRYDPDNTGDPATGNPDSVAIRCGTRKRMRLPARLLIRFALTAESSRF